jgi:hypothetical protein
MTRGLVRKNNFSDLENAERARINLGLATADYNRIRGLYASADVSNVNVQRLAGSTGNFQQQINGINAVIIGINPSLYANRNGDTFTGTWTNQGRIFALSFTASGVTPAQSADASWTHLYQEGNFELTAATAVMNSGVTVGAFVNGNNVVFASGVVPNKRVPVSINGVPYFLEAG